MSILFAILIFEAIIIIHELGHFIAAKASGVKVNEFAIGIVLPLSKEKGRYPLCLACVSHRRLLCHGGRG